MTPISAGFGGGRDWWPFTRLLITATALGAGAHFLLGWELQPRMLFALPPQILGVLSILAMLSFVLADLYLLLLLVPLYVLAVLNDWFYAASKWACRAVLGPRPGPVLATGGLLGETLLFGGLAYLLRCLFLSVF